MKLRELRKQKKLTQVECAKYLNIPLRTYQNYETDSSKEHTMKYEYMMQKLGEYGYIDEDTGILTLKQISELCAPIFQDYGVEYCYLFGSYAKNQAREDSDVDLLVSSSVSGLRFYGLIEALREALNKRVDVLGLEQLRDNVDLINEILKDGIKIYG